MTENTGTQTTYTKSLAVSSTGALALALLTGCSTAEPESGSTPADDATTTAPAESSPAASTPAGSSPAESSPASGDDPAFAAIEALLAEHPDAVITQVDRDDDDTRFEVEAVVGDALRDFQVGSDGSIREDGDQDQDDEDIRRAGEATVTAQQAAEAALEGRTGQTIDSMELDEENGTLAWNVELDDDQGRDGDELLVDASTGEVTQDR